MYTKQNLLQLNKKVDYLKKYLIVEQHKCVLCTDTEHFPVGTTEMCTVHRHRTFSRWYKRNVYCAQTQNIFQMVQKKCVMCTDTEHFLGGTIQMCTVHRHRTILDGTTEMCTEMCTVQRHRTLSRSYNRNVYCEQTQNIFQMVQ